MSVFSPNLLLQKFQESSYDCINYLGNDLSTHGNENLGFLWNSLANKASLCLVNFGGLAGSGSVMNEAKQFSRSISGQ